MIDDAFDAIAVVLDAVGEAADDRAIAAAIVRAGIILKPVEALHDIRLGPVLPRDPDRGDDGAVIGDPHFHAPGIGEGEKIDTFAIHPAPGLHRDCGLGR